jgi:DNA polymerase-4
MDSFYASVEQRDRPELKGRPIIIGGGRRGVVATASYEARKYGVKSGMSAWYARKLCPQGIFIPPNFEKYRAASDQMHNVFRLHTDIIQPLSLDEAYLDVTEDKQGIGDPEAIARDIKEKVLQATQLTISIGVGPNRLVAKVASDMNKPDGLTIVKPPEVVDFLRKLPIRKIPGIGPVTELKCWGVNIRLCEDFWDKDDELLYMWLGSSGVHFKQITQGIDDSPVVSERTRKSCGIEDTLLKDTKSVKQAALVLEALAKDLETRLTSRNISGKTVTLKVKYGDFQRITRQKTLGSPVSDWKSLYDCAVDLLAETEIGTRAVRLLGIAVSSLCEGAEDIPPRQPGLYD